MKRLTFNIKGIKCDNISCDYRDDGADFEPEKYLDMPCPKCGSNLFTSKDFSLLKSMLLGADLLNELLPDPSMNDVTKCYKVIMNGSGVANLEEKTKGQECHR